MKIVCGVDLSEASLGAARVAAALAGRRPDGELTLVHVIDPSHTMDDVVVQVRRDRDARLKQAAEALPAPGGRSVRWRVELGSPAATVAACAEEAGADLVVVSSLGHAHESILRVGGVSERVVQLSAAPVLVVREPGPFEAWARGERRLRVYLGMDGSASSIAAAEWVRKLRVAGPCDVVVGHVYYPEDRRRFGLPPAHAFLEPYPELESLLARDLERMVGDLGGEGDLRIEPRIGLGRTGDHLLEAAEAAGADLIVVGTHHAAGLSRLGSVSTVVLHYAQASVACVPAQADAPSAARAVPEIRTVLAATDFSIGSAEAIAFACATLAGREGTLHLLHVTGAGAGPHEAARLEARMRALVPAPAMAGGRLKIEAVVADGADAARAICEAAERLGADLVCVASRGRPDATRSRLARLLFGSVAASVVRDCRRPVVVVSPRQP